MNESRTTVSRRTAVTGVGAVACCAGLAACGGGGDQGASNKAVDMTVSASDVPVGSGYVDKAHNVVVTQPTKGTYKAFSAVCPHQHCQVGEVTDKAIICPCHGSQFDVATGKVAAGPAQSDLPAKKVAVNGGTLHITG